ncbi:hypothetical protein M378DRAFT_162458 [Amanita muscaria Koide BX008]|uniref:Uncharacterized protein n=1 Tax=Amanita muscaria (strain Koide BX008) TaxID=946122 RepID=A0A0C2TED4_AMAMK|nr:hypothetical protein M378DRAFT_162458 [Amanita muscaria Koide BX008]
MQQEFWNKFLLYPAISRTHESEQQCTDIAAAFLERSNGKPFAFEIHRNSRSRLILDTFLCEATRWQDVSLAIGAKEIPILESTKGRLSQLHSLTLVVSPAVRASRRPNAIKVPQSCSGIFTDAPHLTRVRLSELSTWQFNWSSLISLELIKPVDNPYLLQALPHMQSLERLLVNQPHYAHYNYVRTEPISLPRLRVLTIFGFGLLPILVSPSLNELYIDVEPCNPVWDNALAVCSSFLRRSSCTIQRLGLVGTAFTMDITEQILWLTPDLRFLSIYVDDDKWLLHLLAEMTSGQLLLVPKVQSLRIMFSPMFQHHPAALLTLIASRTAESIPLESLLKELTIALEDTSDLEIFSLLQGVGLDCRARNLDIQFRIVSPVGADSDLGRISGEYDRQFQDDFTIDLETL